MSELSFKSAKREGVKTEGNLLREGKDGTTRTLAPPSNLLPLVYYHSLSACGDANASLSSQLYRDLSTRTCSLRLK